jgi:hypothetical protein
VAGLFPPQKRALSLPAEVPLTPRAAERLAREAAVQPFEAAAKALAMDWRMDLDGRQVQRWSQALGRSLVIHRDREVLQYHQGVRPEGVANDPQLLVIGLDGGRVQTREAEEEADSGPKELAEAACGPQQASGAAEGAREVGEGETPPEQEASRWKEDKVCTISSYLPGDGKELEPQRLVSTCVATMGDAAAFGPMVRVEAERRGVRQAMQILALCDGGNWIDPLLTAFFGILVRIIDWFHASEHLWDCARAAYGAGTAQAAMWAEHWEAWLWDGKVERVIEALAAESARLGPPQKGDGPQHPRRILAQNVGYFTKHRDHMRYPEYRAKGWPIGSGVTEAAVKQFNKRVKGTEQFWLKERVEPILMLRALWISQDERWRKHWANRPAYVNS